MNAFRDDLRALVSKHIAELPVEQIVTLIDGSSSKSARGVGNAHALAQPYVKLNALGESQADDCPEWVAVRDLRTGLEWTRAPVGGKKYNWADAKKAASEVRLCERSDWRAPTIQELLSLVDYARVDPAIDTAYFDCPADWFWSATEAKSPSGAAWGVDFGGGYSDRGNQDGGGWCRAVRAGQQWALGI